MISCFSYCPNSKPVSFFWHGLVLGRVEFDLKMRQKQTKDQPQQPNPIDRLRHLSGNCLFSRWHSNFKKGWKAEEINICLVTLKQLEHMQAKHSELQTNINITRGNSRGWRDINMSYRQMTSLYSLFRKTTLPKTFKSIFKTL